MFSSTEASTSQWESSVFVSPIKAPALMILDEYGLEERGRFPAVLASILVDVSRFNALEAWDNSSYRIAP